MGRYRNYTNLHRANLFAHALRIVKKKKGLFLARSHVEVLLCVDYLSYRGESVTSSKISSWLKSHHLQTVSYNTTLAAISECLTNNLVEQIKVGRHFHYSLSPSGLLALRELEAALKRCRLD